MIDEDFDFEPYLEEEDEYFREALAVVLKDPSPR